MCFLECPESLNVCLVAGRRRCLEKGSPKKISPEQLKRLQRLIKLKVAPQTLKQLRKEPPKKYPNLPPS
jgi:hypothetical protein